MKPMPDVDDYKDALSDYYTQTKRARKHSSSILYQLLKAFVERIGVSSENFIIQNNLKSTGGSNSSSLSPRKVSRRMTVEGEASYFISTLLNVKANESSWTANLRFEIRYSEQRVQVRVGEASETISLELEDVDEAKTSDVNDFTKGLSERVLNEIKNAAPDGLEGPAHIDYPATHR